MWFLPKQTEFYALFRQQAGYIMSACRLLRSCAEARLEDAPAIAAEIERVEQEADTVIHEVFNRLQKTFITPIDPEDIHRLASVLDDVVDAIEDTAFRLVLFRPEPMPPPVLSLCLVLESCGEEIEKALETLSDGGAVSPHCIHINRLEDDADRLYRDALTTLFRRGGDPLKTLEEKELFDYLELAVDRCEDVADILENIAIKNA